MWTALLKAVRVLRLRLSCRRLGVAKAVVGLGLQGLYYTMMGGSC